MAAFISHYSTIWKRKPHKKTAPTGRLPYAVVLTEGLEPPTPSM